MAANTASIKQSLAALLAQVKQANAGSEVGSVGGETSHPVKNVDDNTGACEEGARGRENDKDLKADQGPMGVESAPKSPGGDQESFQETIGPLDAKSTGKDPASETNSVKGDKEDPGTSHPAKTTDGQKYGSVIEQLQALVAQSEKIGSAILKELATPTPAPAPAPEPKQAAAQPAAQPAATADQNTQKAAEAGYDLAGLLAGSNMSPQEKQSCDQFVYGAVREAVERGTKRAMAFHEFASGFFAQKQADEEGEQPADEESDDSDKPTGDHKGSDKGGPPADGGGMGGGEPDGDEPGAGGPPLGDEHMPPPEELLAMLAGSGGGGMGGGDPMGGMIGAGAPGAGAEAGMAGGPGMGADAGMGAAGHPGGDEAIDPEMLMQLMQQLGINPAELEQKAAAALRQKQAKNEAQNQDKKAAKRKQAVAKMLLDLIG